MKTLKPILRTTTPAKDRGWEPDTQRGNRHQRGYGTAWEKLREEILERDTGLCQPCLRNGRVTQATHVDHTTPKAEARALGWHESKIDHPSNLQSICDACHKAKSSAEGARARAATIQP